MRAAAGMHFLVTVVWTFLHGQTTMGGFFLGAVASFFMLWALEGVLGVESYIRRVRALFSFITHFLFSMVKSNFEMGLLSLTPGIGKKAGCFTLYDASDLSPLETVLLAHFINLTPGTTVADRNHDGYFILHSFPKADEDELREKIDESLKCRILAFTR